MTELIKGSFFGYIKLGFLLANCFLVIGSYVYFNHTEILSYKDIVHDLPFVALLSIIGFLLTYFMLPPFMQMFLKKKIQGVDINKVEDYQKLDDPNRKIVPESCGLVPAVAFLIIMIFYIFLFHLITPGDLDLTKSIKQQKMSSILVSIGFMILLGFVDDILDLRWRYKLVLPAIASIPIVISHTGSSSVTLPYFLHFLSPSGILELGILYNIYISMLSIFCTNAINIYAGINGLEVGQSLIIALTMVLYDLIGIVNDPANISAYANSLVILFFFLACSFPLFYYNIFPSSCFIGDTFCYFAGITLASAAIVGHFEYTMLLFCIPQILNFLLSIPQLFGIIPCPRHRLPTYNAKTKKLTSKKEQLNVLNQGLRLIGPTGEQDLCTICLLFQVVCSGFGLYARFSLYPKFFPSSTN